MTILHLFLTENIVDYYTKNELEKQANLKVCVGTPSSHGYPVWFILPDELLSKDSEVWNGVEEMSLTQQQDK